MTSSSPLFFTPPRASAPSAGSSSKKYSPAVAWRGKTIYSGSLSLTRELQRLFRETNQNSLQACYEPSLRWGRDARVERLDGSHLIPFELWADHAPVRDLFYAMLPLEEVHQIKSGEDQWGRGFSKEYRRSAKLFAKEKGIEHHLGDTCVEGGNCRIFIDGNGRPKAAIGYHSLILSMLALEQQGYFDKYPDSVERFACRIKEPAEDSYRVAKNIALCNEKAEHCQREGIPYTPAFKQERPVEPEKKPKYKAAAIEFEAKLAATRRLIAYELGIPEKDIAFLIQEHFHIDLEAMPGPNGIFFLHNEELALKVLQARAARNKPNETELLAGYIAHSQERLERSKAKFARNAKALEAINLKVVPVAADFIGAKQEDRVNFANGLLINDRKEPRLYTNGTDTTALNEYFKMSFLERLEEVCPYLRVYFVHDQTDRMQRNLGVCVGGLHCLTYIGGVSAPLPLPLPSDVPAPQFLAPPPAALPADKGSSASSHQVSKPPVVIPLSPVDIRLKPFDFPFFHSRSHSVQEVQPQVVSLQFLAPPSSSGTAGRKLTLTTVSDDEDDSVPRLNPPLVIPPTPQGAGSLAFQPSGKTLLDEDLSQYEWRDPETPDEKQ